MIKTCRKTSEEGNLIPSPGEKRIVALGRDGRFKNLLKKTSLKHWLGSEGNPPALAHPKLESAGSLNRGCNHSMNDARSMTIFSELVRISKIMFSIEFLTASGLNP